MSVYSEGFGDGLNEGRLPRPEVAVESDDGGAVGQGGEAVREARGRLLKFLQLVPLSHTGDTTPPFFAVQ